MLKVASHVGKKILLEGSTSTSNVHGPQACFPLADRLARIWPNQERVPAAGGRIVVPSYAAFKRCNSC